MADMDPKLDLALAALNASRALAVRIAQRVDGLRVDRDSALATAATDPVAARRAELLQMAVTDGEAELADVHGACERGHATVERLRAAQE